ncbi:hypothetical protein [Ruminiclostridium cellobioparum]|uniref:Uncharacterized protein n=1 Tax=Ruminiclostridium cellobioparum subsp. termitidis CT1112 TaxID=1195236 RepID=S0FPZ4_RUMCE|nr:hypothetical protein [Ruminiclostridium cellobioparum]EMS73927.1 hypothetical protein CTER_5517 [Ruminiclostridium cellobioparum subsp. termitidis CT1112]
MDNNKNTCDNGFFSLSPCELTLLATAISIILAEGIDGCQRDVLGNFLMSVGQNIATFDAQANCLNQS